VTLACRDQGKAAAARQEILEDSKGAVSEQQLDLLPLDLNSLGKTREAAEEFLARDLPLHILVNNAGIMIPMERRTEDGFEAHFGINHLAHFLFTNLLLDALKAAGGARVVCVSSAAMVAASMTPSLDDLNWERRKFSGVKSYGDSKLMNLLFAREFSRRHKDDGVVANALHPGVIATELARDQSPLLMLAGIVALPFMKSVPQGAAASVQLAVRPEYAQRGGLYIVHCKEKKPDHKLGTDDDLARDLWRRSCELTGLTS
jgi:NAD(P)-dependent dehydrogenase (short-subunit alcohol dehydrogenase family)